MAAMTAAWSSSGTIGAAGEALLDVLHEPGQRAQALAGGVDPHRVGGLLGDLGRAPGLRGAVRGGARMGGSPARGDFGRRPGTAALRIGQDDDVQMVRHHGVGQDVDGEGTGRLADQLGDPGAAVLGLVAAEVGSADAAGDEVEGAGTLVIDQEATGEGHSPIVIRINPLSTWTHS